MEIISREMLQTKYYRTVMVMFTKDRCFTISSAHTKADQGLNPAT